MPLSKERLYTTDDIYTLPEGKRAELIDGQIFDMAPPSTTHQIITGELYAAIRNYIRKNDGSCKPYISPFAVFLNEDDQNYLEPDVSVVCSPDKIDEKGCHGAPDWLIEVVSPATQSRDYGIKLFKYRTAGVREYWIVNPMKKIVNVYDFENEIGTGLYSFDDDIPVSIYPGFSIKISDLIS
ncbi:MAG: Uma2 family endonuclease [Clostridiales bacterium]|nr:Uma2 family endonuclease [Clostridiales bacterium]MDY3745333.1 Uma2 family endonuclease [Lachnospiraceae bacterium]